MPLTSTRSVLLQPQASEGPKAASAAPVIKNRNKADHFSLCLPLRMSFSSGRDTADSTGSETILTHRSFLTVNGRKLRKMALPQTFDKPPEDIYAIKFLQLNNSKEIPTQKCSELWVSSLSAVTWPPRVCPSPCPTATACGCLCCTDHTVCYPPLVVFPLFLFLSVPFFRFLFPICLPTLYALLHHNFGYYFCNGISQCYNY